MHTDHESTLQRPILVLRVLLLGRFHLEHAQRLNLEELDAHQDVIDRGFAQTSQGLQALFLATAVHQMTGRLGHEHQHAGSQNERRENLNAHRDLPGGNGLAVAGASDVVGAIANLYR